MMKTFALTLGAAVFVGGVGGNHVARAQGTGITPEIRQADARLDKPVTVLVPHTTLKELLQTLSTQTGVEIVLAPSPRLAVPAPLLGVGADPKDPPLILSPLVVAPPDTELVALLQNKPLGDVLDALYSMMSYQGARWTWEQSKTSVGYRYTLRPSRTLGNVVDAARLDIQRDFEARATKMQATLKLPPDKLAEAAKTDTEAAMLLSGDSISASPSVRQGIELFYSLPEAQRQQILSGQSLVLPVDALGDKGKAFADARMRNITPPLPLGTQQTIRFSATSNELYAFPSLFITPNDAGGIGYFGSTFTSALWRDRLASVRWHLKDDTLDPVSLMNRTLTAPVKPLPPFAPAPTDDAPSQMLVPLSRAMPWLWQTAHVAPVSLLVVLPTRRQYININGRSIHITTNVSYGDPTSVALRQPVYGRKLGEALKTLHDARATNWDHKWRGDILLLRDATAPFRIPPIPE